MRMPRLLQVILLLFAVWVFPQAQTNVECISDATISAQGNVDEISICQGDDLPDVVRFRTSTLATPFGYVVTDENNNILLVTLSSVIDLEGLPQGNLRVWAFSFIGELLAEPGMNAATDQLGSICSALTTNFITISSVIPEGGTVATDEGLSSVVVCVGDGVPDIVNFTTTSTSSSYTYAITDEDGIILAFADGDSFDFDGAGVGVCRVYGISHAGAIIAEIGDSIFDGPLAEECADLSDNFIEVDRLQPDGGTVSLTNGETTATVCVGDGEPDVLSFQNTSTAATPYVYVITDENNVILALADGNTFDFDGAGAGVCRVWGLSYTGNLLAQPGDDAAAAPLADDCFELSENFITVDRRDVDGGELNLSDGSTETVVCLNEADATLSFTNTSASTENYVYVITDEDNNILAVADGDTFDFSDAPAGICRVWGLSFTGDLIAEVGDNAAAVALSDECFELSSNFITVDRVAVDGGTVNLSDGSTETVACVNDGTADVLSFENTSDATADYLYVITDEDNLILAVTDADTFDFSNALPGICRIWGLSLTGGLSATLGDDAGAVDLSTECFDLSDNFITVNRKEAEGGSVSLPGGATEATICAGDDEADILTFENTSDADLDYVYLVTDEDNNILTIPPGDAFDFNEAPPGVCRVWGLSYSGNLTAAAGDNAAAVALSDECFDLSDNFITVTRVEVDGGEVTLPGGAVETNICGNDGIADTVTVVTTSGATGSYLYVLTDTTNTILSVSLTPDVSISDDFSNVTRIWGLSFTGNLTAGIGDDAAAVPLSDECFELSSVFVTVTKKLVNGGPVATEDGSTEVSLCVNDGEPDVVTTVIDSTQVLGDNYIFVITDDENNILDFSDDGLVDFEGVPPGVCRIWGLAYSGNLTAMIGDNAAAVDLSDECFDLSDNFITVNRIAVDGGTVSLSNGDTSIDICVGDGESDQLDFSTTSMAGASYVFVVTDEENNILNLSFSSLIDFEFAGNGICRLWGVSYTGNFLAGIGDNIDEVAFTDGCFEFSDNFVTVNRTYVNGGVVTTEDGETEVFVCVTDNQSSVLNFVAETDATEADYAFVVTDEENEIFVVLDGSSVDFGAVPAGAYRVWGLSFTGMVIAQIGDNAAQVPLSEGCFNLSDNFVTVTVDEVEGGTITGDGMQDIFYTCPGDGNPDVITFDSIGATGNYAYVITDEANVILAIANGDSNDFDGAPAGNCRVWGLAFSGNVLAMPGDTATNVTLTDGCFDLSDNFLTVVREVPEGGSVALAGGGDFLFSCPSDTTATVIELDSTGASAGLYAYVLTDPANVILDVTFAGSYDIGALADGVYRIWGLAYTGELLAAPGDSATVVNITDDCWDLSDNFITIERAEPDGGAVATSSGATEVVTCDGDGEPDPVTFVADTPTNSPYAFVVTDTENNIVDFVDGNTYDFEGGDLDSLRVWGLAYTGLITAQVGDNAAAISLSDGCFDLSDNFVLVVRGAPAIDSISTADGLTEVDLCIGDGIADSLEFVVTGASDAPLIFLLTDPDGFLTGTLADPVFDFDNLTAGGAYRIYALSYTGALQLFPGDNILDGSVPLSSGCFELSDNFLAINATQVDGGLLFTPNGETTFFTCPGDGEADLIEFFNTSIAENAAYLYFLTDADNEIVGIVDGESFDFETSGVGVTRIWGVSYTGELTAGFGDDITEAVLSDGCFTISENFIEVNRDTPAGGEVSTADGATEVLFCGTPTDSTLTFTTSSTSLAGYQFVLTDEFNDVIALPESNAIDFGALPQGLYRVWGISYTGDLLLAPGENLFTLEPASSCFEISANFVEVFRSADVDGGEISTLFNEEVFYACPNNDNPDLVVLSTTSLDTNYVYIITDTANTTLIAPLGNNLVDFEGAAERTYRIWGLSYTGALASPFNGLDADVEALSDSCFALSSNFITVNVATPEGGMVTTQEGALDTTLVDDGPGSGLVTFASQGASIAQYTYLVTNLNGDIVGLADENAAFDFSDFSDFASDSLQVWGLSFTGDLMVGIGDNLSGMLSDDCFDLSDNAVLVVLGASTPAGGQVLNMTASPTDEHAPAMLLTVAPNPAKDWVNVNVTLQDEPQEGATQLLLFDATGNRVLQQRIPTVIGNNHLELDLSALPAGLYILRLQNGQAAQQERILKQE